MKSNDTIKKFNAFVSCNFFGYSAHTLYQELRHSYPAEVACIIHHDLSLLDRALDARDYIEYCIATHEYERLAVLIDEALDLYIDRVISLDEFKLIVSVAQ